MRYGISAAFPEILRDQFWADREAGTQCTQYLGLERIRF